MAATPAIETPLAERRLVTVLFADLVGFTAASEGRDAEETRDLLSRYFDLARTLIERYGGTVEKFIGDAVMAVWGTPVATENDAERAVRAALELVGSIPDLGPGLEARAGVLTGEAAVTLGADGEGMVAGDLVNTASRIQSAAQPGTVLVGEATRRSTEEAIVYESTGEHELKGKAEPLGLWKALRVVSGVGGTLRSAGLEPPFVGRERELKLIKELLHGCATEGRAHLVSVTGIAGIGKSRLAWEFYKYFDGIVDTVWWHRGRCLAYGEGVTYWALADMIRMRCLIGEDEDPSSARNKLTATLEEHVLDAEERSFIEPRLAHLLGLEETPSDRQDLFAAWRLFFERLADTNPVVLAFEDLHWADTSLLDFIEYLLEWSRESPLYVVTLARPELQERRPGWGSGQRNFSSIYLEPLSPAAMNELLEGLVPGLPDRLEEQILARAQGVPLYAVETVRMLLDRGLLVQDGPIYAPTGEIDTLEVPETLHALIAARLDGLSAEERRLLQDGAVLGKTFTVAALAALAPGSNDEIEPLLAGLVRKEVLGVQSDPRSPERGQYGFLQDLVRHVAYETLSKRERKTRHLAAAEHLEAAFAVQEEEIAEVLASHYLAAAEAAPDAEDAAAIRTKAGEMLRRAGERAASLGAPDEGQRYYEQAAGLARDPLLEAELLEQAGRLAVQANRSAEARERLERAIRLYADAGQERASARASAALADADVEEGRLAEAATRLGAAVDQLEQGEPSSELAAALAELGRAQALSGRIDDADSPLERALTLAERLQLPGVFVEALTTKGIVLMVQGRLGEARILLEAAIARAHEEQLHASALRAENNLLVVLESSDRYAEEVDLAERTIALAQRRGDRRWQANIQTGLIQPLFLLGRWDEALLIAEQEDPAAVSELTRGGLMSAALIECERGDLKAAEARLVEDESMRASDNPQTRAGHALVEARVLRARGRNVEALAAGDRGLATLGELAITDTAIKAVLVEAIEAALAIPDLDKAEELLAIPQSLEPGELTPFLQASAARLRARLDAARGSHDGIDDRFRAATALFREFGIAFYQAVTQLEHGEWLIGKGRADEADPLLTEAAETMERLQATPWLERVQALTATPGQEVPA